MLVLLFWLGGVVEKASNSLLGLHFLTTKRLRLGPCYHRTGSNGLLSREGIVQWSGLK
jgi:hypothetical protein